MRIPIALARASLIVVAVGELLWSLAFYLRPALALGALGRGVIDPVMARQYPLYLASVALAYALAATNPARYRGIIWICVIQRAVELVAAIVDWRTHALATSTFLGLASLEIAVGIALFLVARSIAPGERDAREPRDLRDLGLRRMLRGFGGLEIFWFFASTIFVHFGSSLLAWKLQDLYTTQQQGIGLLIIGLVSLLAASDLARYRLFVWIPVASQLIGIANSFNEIHRGSIGWGGAATQWTIEAAIVGTFAYFSRRHVRRALEPTSAVVVDSA